MWMPLDDGKGERDLQKTKVMRTRRECVYKGAGWAGGMAWVVGWCNPFSAPPPMAFDYARH